MTTTSRPTSRPSPARLGPGWHLYPGPDGTWRLSAPDGSFTRVRATGRDADLLRVVAAGGPVPEPLSGALRSRGALAPGAAGPAPVPVVHVEGQGPLASAAAGLLGGQARVVSGPVDEGAVAACDALLCTAPHLTDERWRRVDAWCAGAGTTWTTAAGESGSLVLGPAGLPGVTASYGDARGRRLAAAPLPDELRALWSHLETAPPAPLELTPQVCAVAAGLLVHDLLEALAGRAAGHQVVLDPRTLTLSRHRVLPLPTGIAAHAL